MLHGRNAAVLLALILKVGIWHASCAAKTEHSLLRHWAVRVSSCTHMYWACVQALSAWRVDQQNWTPQVESNSIISPAELIPTSQQHHTVNSLSSAPTLYTHSDWLRLAARTAIAESLCPCLQSGSFCPHTHWLHLASMNSFNSLLLEEQRR